MKLNYKEFGSGNPLIILHGLFGSLDNWQTMAKTLAETGLRVITVDARNHGQSPWSDTWNYKVMADDVVELMNDLNIDSAVVLGHSMGGKTAMQLAASHPERVSKLIVADIAPREYPPHHDEILDALMAVDFDQVSSRSDAADILQEHIPSISVVQFLVKSVHRKEKDRFGWRFNLEVISKEYDEVRKNPVESEYPGPVLFINGGKSNYIRPDRDLGEIRKYFPEAEIKTISDAGHWLHAEAPEEFYGLVKAFIQA